MTEITLSDTQVEEIVTALKMRMSYIETGTVTLRANDAIGRGDHKKVRALDADQRKLISEIELLITELERQSYAKRFRG